MIEDFDRDLFKKCMPQFSEHPIVFDIGAHEGHYTEFVLEMIPGADCYLFEPNPSLYRHIFKYKNHYHFAVSDSPGYKEFYLCSPINNELSSLYKREIFNETGFDLIKVPCVSVDSFCHNNSIKNIEYIKVDVEGAELDVLNGCHEMMTGNKIKFLQIEYGGTYKDANIKFIHIIRTANVHGYKVYELVKDNLSEITEENFVEDYRYGVFLLTYLPC